MNHPHSTTNAIRIRWLNPIGYAAYDTPMAELLAQIKRPDTELEVVSLAMEASPTHLEYRCYEAHMLQHIVEAARDCAQNAIDALVIGCFYDPGLEDAREISGETLVLAPCQASLMVANQLANRYSILVGREKWVEQMHARVRHYGQQDRLASFRSLDMGVNEFQCDIQLTRERILQQAHLAVNKDKAEAIILGCTCEFGFYQTVQKEVGVPVIDALIAPFMQAESAARMKRLFNWKPSRRWSCEPPPEEEITRFGLFQRRELFANRVCV